jgi:hypothetical protein
VAFEDPGRPDVPAVGIEKIATEAELEQRAVCDPERVEPQTSTFETVLEKRQLRTHDPMEHYDIPAQVLPPSCAALSERQCVHALIALIAKMNPKSPFLLSAWRPQQLRQMVRLGLLELPNERPLFEHLAPGTLIIERLRTTREHTSSTAVGP